MRTRPFLLGLFAAVAASACATPDVMPGLLLVKPTPGQTTAARSAYKTLGATLVRSIPQIGWDTIRVKSGTTVQAAMTKLAASRAIARTEPDYVATVTDLPNDPMIAQQYSLTKMHLSEAWGIGKGDKSAIVAIIDTGADLNHPDLKSALLPGYDFGNGDNDPSDTFGHGTHCCGIAAAVGDNGVGIAGIAYGASILPVKVFPDGSGSTGDDVVAQGIVWAADHGANVISMSLGGEGDSQAQDDAIDYAYSKNVVIVAAAGNNNSSTHFFPAANPKCIAVGASDSNDAKASFSNYNPAGDPWVDVAAPGVNIVSTYPPSAYAYLSGTSMACPNTAGLATLIISQAGVGTLTNEEVRAIIEDNCDPIGDWIAHGRVNAYKALLATPLSITDVSTATEIVPEQGTLSNGTADVLQTGDGISATIRSEKKAGVGLQGAMSAAFPLNGLTTDEVRTATVSFVATGERLALLQIYFKDSMGQWSLYATANATGVAQQVTLKMDATKAAAYLSGGELKIMVRSYVPVRLQSRYSGTTSVDQLQVTFAGRRNPGGTP